LPEAIRRGERQCEHNAIIPGSLGRGNLPKKTSSLAKPPEFEGEPRAPKPELGYIVFAPSRFCLSPISFGRGRVTRKQVGVRLVLAFEERAGERAHHGTSSFSKVTSRHGPKQG